MRCDMETLINKIATNKLNKQVEVDFSIIGSLPDCKRINTKDYIKVIDASSVTVETVLAYNKYNKPANLLECADVGGRVVLTPRRAARRTPHVVGVAEAGEDAGLRRLGGGRIE